MKTGLEVVIHRHTVDFAGPRVSGASSIIS